MNVTAPIMSISSTFQILTGTQVPAPVTVTAISPTTNITQYFYSSLGSTAVATSAAVVDLPTSVGIYTHCVVNEDNGCSSCVTFTIESGSPGTVSVPEIPESKNSFSIYPNPAKDLVHLKIPDIEGEIRFVLYDSRGELLRNDIILSSEKNISIDDLPDGVYILQMKDADSHVKCRRFVVSK